MEKRIMLLIKACGVKGEDQECKNIYTQAEMYGITTSVIEPQSVSDLKKSLKGGIKYDYIYLSSHGSADGLCNHTNSIKLTWLDFGLMLCESACMKENCILMLSCCRGGLNQVAYDLIYCCENISYVVGPRQSLPADDMLISFNIFLYNVRHRGLDPIVACEKIKAGTDIRFVCFDRLEVEAEAGYILKQDHYREEMERRWQEMYATMETPKEVKKLMERKLIETEVIPH
jgi:hypothetical protein